MDEATKTEFAKEISKNLHVLRTFMPKTSREELTAIINTYVYATEEIPADEKEDTVQLILDISDEDK